jgi:type I restriction enzyme R subunit
VASTNGNEIYQICLKTGEEKRVEDFLSPQALWEKTYSDQNDWREQFSPIPLEGKRGTWQLRYYQEIKS